MKSTDFKILTRLFLICVLISIQYSCSQSHGASSIPSSFVGTWRGTYAGTSSGTWTANIANDGSITGVVQESILSHQATGSVNSSGSLSLTIGDVTSGARFIGQLNGTQATGTWVNPSSSGNGTFIGTKQP